MDALKSRKAAIAVFVAVVLVFSLLGFRLSLDRRCRAIERAFFADTLTSPGTQLGECAKYANRILSVIRGQLDDSLYAAVSSSRTWAAPLRPRRRRFSARTGRQQPIIPPRSSPGSGCRSQIPSSAMVARHTAPERKAPRRRSGRGRSLANQAQAKIAVIGSAVTWARSSPNPASTAAGKDAHWARIPAARYPHQPSRARARAATAAVPQSVRGSRWSAPRAKNQAAAGARQTRRKNKGNPAPR